MSTPSASAPTPPPARPNGRRRSGGEIDRRTLVISAMVLFGAIAAGILAIAVFSDPGEPTPRLPNELVTPNSLERPNQGTEPQNPGDRGGWQQLTVLVLIIAALVAISFLILRGGGSKAKANRERWKAAGASGHDGAIEP